jgi:hypothetical protein
MKYRTSETRWELSVSSPLSRTGSSASLPAATSPAIHCQAAEGFSNDAESIRALVFCEDTFRFALELFYGVLSKDR